MNGVGVEVERRGMKSRESKKGKGTERKIRVGEGDRERRNDGEKWERNGDRDAGPTTPRAIG